MMRYKRLHGHFLCSFLLFLFFGICFTMPSAYASITRSFNDSQNMERWNFKFDMGQAVGYNLDLNTMGMESKFTLDMKTNLAYKNRQGFIEEETIGHEVFAGVIKIKDFEITFGIDKTLAQDDQAYSITPKISWGRIEGMIYMGSVYLVLSADNHDDQFIDDILDDKNMGFSVIDYSVIPLAVTASYAEQIETLDTSGLLYNFTATKNSGGGVPSTAITEKDKGALQIGYRFEDVFRVEVGLSTEYSYKELAGGDRYVPMSASALLEFTPFRQFKLQLFNSMASGINGRLFFEQDNPYVVRTIFGYSFSLGSLLFLTPQVGVKVGLSNPSAINPSVKVINAAPSETKNKKSLSVPVEGTLGIIFDWRNLGINNRTDDYISFNASRADTVKDGIGLAGSVGYTKHTVFQELLVPYVGAKLSLWEYEYEYDNDSFDNTQALKDGLIPNVRIALVGNLNYSFGGKYTGFHKYFDEFSSASKSEIVIAPRLDYGFALDMSYRYSFIRHTFGAIFKRFDALQSDDTFIIDGVVNSKEKGRAFLNKEDLRLKIGLDVLDIIPYMVFSVDWVSGDLYKLGDDNLDRDFTDFDYFYASNGTGLSSFESNAKLGYIELSGVYKFRR